MSRINLVIAGAVAMTAGIATAQSMPGVSSTGAASQQMDAPGATSGAPQAGATQSAVQAASAADVKAGAPVLDTQGGTVGTIESVSGDNAVLSTGTVRVQLAVSSFGKSDKGLVISMTKAQVEAAAAKAGGTGG